MPDSLILETLLKLRPDSAAETEIETKMGQYARVLLQIEMKKRGLTYRDLVDKLADNGVDESERNLRNKVARGTFSAGFFLICLAVMGATRVSIGI